MQTLEVIVDGYGRFESFAAAQLACTEFVDHVHLHRLQDTVAQDTISVATPGMLFFTVRADTEFEAREMQAHISGFMRRAPYVLYFHAAVREVRALCGEYWSVES